MEMYFDFLAKGAVKKYGRVPWQAEESCSPPAFATGALV
jgi:hypothetical protein